MEESTSREKVLKAIRDALVNPMHLPGEREDYVNQIYAKKDDEFLDVLFAESFSIANGGFVYNKDIRELIENLRALLLSKSIVNLFCFDPEIKTILDETGVEYFDDDEQSRSCEAAITGCEYLVARLGSIMVSSAQGWGRKGIAYPPVHIVIAERTQLVYDLNHAFIALKEKYPDSLPSMITVVTGPSRTADIEKTLVMGAHGPEELYLFLLDNEPEGLDSEFE
jgi:L-lactate dehydrogenase complex protein LldG